VLTLLKDRRITIKNSISKLQQVYKKIESGVEFIKDNPALDIAVKTAISAIPIAGPVIREMYDGVAGNGSEKQNTQDLLRLLQNLEKMNDKQFVDQAIQIKQNRKEILKNREVFLEQIKRSEDLLSNKILVTNESVLKNREFLERLEKDGEITHELLLEIKHLTKIKDEKLESMDKKLDRILRGESAQYRESVETSHDKAINTKSTISHTKNFVGRQFFIDKIKTMMEESNEPISIVGGAGLGKSKLAYEVIARYQSKYDKVIIFDFTKFRRYGKFLDDFGEYLEIDKNNFMILDDKQKYNAILNILGKSDHVLVYADNFETISRTFQPETKNKDNLDDARSIIHLLKSVPRNTLVLLTSRIRDNLDGERIVDLEGLSKEEGREMFLKVAHNKFSSNPSDKIKLMLESLSEKTGGHPLSIELLAHSYKKNGIPEIEKMLEHLGVGITKNSELNERLRSLELSFDFSIKALEKNYAEVLPKLTIFSSYFTPQGAEQILGINHDMLQTFYERSLLRRIDFDEDNPLEFRLYGFHAATRNYLEKQIDIPSLEQKVKESFVRYYEELSDFTYKSLSNEHRVPSMNRFKSMIQGENDFEKAASLDESSGSFIYNQVGLVVQNLGNLSSALQYAKKALAIDEKNNDEVSMAIRYNNIGQILQDQGNLKGALKYTKKSLRINKKNKNELCVEANYNNIGVTLHAQGNLKGALKYLKKALTIAEKNNDEMKMAIDYNNIGAILHSQGKLDDALKYIKKAFTIDEKNNDEMKMARRYNNIGAIFRDKGKVDDALKYYNKSLELLQNLGDQVEIVLVHISIGRVYMNMKNYDRSIKSITQAESFVNSFEKETGNKHPSSDEIKNIMSELREKVNKSK